MQLDHIGRRDVQALRGIRHAAGVLPEDAGTALWRNDGVNGVFQHIHAVGRSQRQRAAAAALADDDGDDRRAEAHHFQNVLGNGLALPALLGLRAAVGAERVDKANNGAVEFFGLLHQAQSLAIALRHGAAEVVAHAACRWRYRSRDGR